MSDIKPHLTYEQQLKKITDRGLSNSNREAAIAALKRVGYYRLSAYTYPFRIREADGRVLDDFEPDATLEDALRLYAFDAKIRSILLEGLNAIEIGLSVQIGYTLGKRDPLGHIGTDHLNFARCAELVGKPEDKKTRYEAWHARYEKLRGDAKDEEYVKHHMREYDGRLPIWVATEFMDFGCLVWLFDLLVPEDKKKITESFGLNREAYGVLHRWLKALNILRNNAAHSNRVWNRVTVDAPPKFPNKFVDERLHHTNAIENPARLRLYVAAAMIAYLTTQVDPGTQWPRSFATQAKKLGSVRGRTLQTEMGFPDDWATKPLWHWLPRF
ncbi:Abi family protein [Curtobacterium sp. MCPF17_047]|uniref:Abi family protein n=1 Tax=Curtobacterium sp. MCPF17_047 TaxID=2175654 RepID=UPI0015E88C68|nr:Abi family protein [Curtobacterium sp. MCPF17_047]